MATDSVARALALSASGGEPSAYLKSASVSNKTLTLTNKDDSIVTFTDTGSVVSASATGTSTTEAGYITVDGTEWKLPSGGGSGWDLSDRIKAGTGTNAVTIGNLRSCTTSGDSSLIVGNHYRANATGQGSLIIGYDSNQYPNGGISATGSGAIAGGNLYNFTTDQPGILASGAGSIALGYGFHHISANDRVIKATQTASVAIGQGVQSLSMNQTVIGKFNETDSNNTYAFIIGNGTGGTSAAVVPSNALTVDWNGNLVCNNIPAPPSTDGTYQLTCTVSSGVATYSWVAQA